MERPTISTKTGDKGMTGLFGGKRVSKTDPRIHAYGTIDELNAVIGIVLTEEILTPVLRKELAEVQRMLFIIGADLATPFEDNKASVPRVTLEHVSILESWGAALEQTLPALQKFVLPSGHRAGALLHLARTVCRRAERWIVGLSESEQVNSQLIIYVNRLSDYLFLASRTVNKTAGVAETEWNS